jgi:hypothetical protein
MHTPATTAGDYLARYTHVQEIVITARASIDASEPDTSAYNRARWFNVMDNVLSFNVDSPDDKYPDKRLVWHQNGIGCELEERADNVFLPWAARILPGKKRHHCDYIMLDTHGMVNQPIWWTGRRAGIHFWGEWHAGHPDGQYAVWWLLGLYNRAIEQGDADRLPELVLYDMDRKLFSAVPLVSSDPQEVERITRDRLRYLFAQITPRPSVGLLDTIMSRVQLEVSRRWSNPGDPCEELPCDRPHPVSTRHRARHQLTA